MFECPLERLEVVAELTARVMCETVEERYPQLCPRADINIRTPRCWNKDGDGEALERWIAEAEEATRDAA